VTDGDEGQRPTANVAGRTYPEVPFTIEPERVAAFARAIGADPAAGVPPTFASVYALGVTAPQLFGDPEAAVDFAKLLHAEQEFEWERHPRAGETVVSQGRVASDVSRRGMRLVSFETDTKGAGGEPICRSRALFVIRS
jgi:N-terminal half of MaoC dehydratase